MNAADNVSKRDIRLDIFRGLAMMYIVCIIHVIYMLKLPFVNSFVSLLLFEMPVIFFISGASYNISEENRGRENKRPYLSFIWSRIKRVVLPYYIYVFVGLIFLILINAIYLVRGLQPRFPITQDNIMGMLMLQGSDLFPFSWHLWFIVPFLLVCLAAPLLRRLFAKRMTFVIAYMIAAGILLWIIDTTCEHWNDSYIMIQIRNFIVYGAFFVSGFLYRRNNTTLWLIIACCCLGVLVILNKSNYYGIDMQTNKFPPNLMFYLFGCMMLAFFGCLSKYLTFKPNKIINRYNKAGFTIYLYQNFIFVILAYLFDMFFVDYGTLSRIGGFIVAVFLSLFLNYALSFLTYPIERWIMSHLK